MMCGAVGFRSKVSDRGEANTAHNRSTRARLRSIRHRPVLEARPTNPPLQVFPLPVLPASAATNSACDALIPSVPLDLLATSASRRYPLRPAQPAILICGWSSPVAPARGICALSAHGGRYGFWAAKVGPGYPTATDGSVICREGCG